MDTQEHLFLQQTVELAFVIWGNSYCLLLHLHLLHTTYLSDICQYHLSYGFYRLSYLFLKCSGDLNLILALSFSLSLSGLQICQSKGWKRQECTLSTILHCITTLQTITYQTNCQIMTIIMIIRSGFDFSLFFRDFLKGTIGRKFLQ